MTTPLQAPVPVNFDELFSKEACDRLMPGLRVLATAFNGLPGMIPLHGGLPPKEAFPLSSMQLTLKDGTTIDINDPIEVAISFCDTSSAGTCIWKLRCVWRPDTCNTCAICGRSTRWCGMQVNAAQQYNLTLKGHPSLHQWVTEHTQELHAPGPGHETIVTGGSNYTLEACLSCLPQFCAQLCHTCRTTYLQTCCKAETSTLRAPAFVFSLNYGADLQRFARYCQLTSALRIGC